MPSASAKSAPPLIRDPAPQPLSAPGPGQAWRLRRQPVRIPTFKNKQDGQTVAGFQNSGDVIDFGGSEVEKKNATIIWFGRLRGVEVVGRGGRGVKSSVSQTVSARLALLRFTVLEKGYLQLEFSSKLC